MKKLFKIAKFFLYAFICSCVLAIAGVAAIFWYLSRDLPGYSELAEYDPPTITRISTMDGKILSEYAKEKRIYVNYNDIPKLVIEAFLAAEDYNYFSHPGIDVQSLFRAAAQNVIHYLNNKRLVGGSTITQQVVKDFLLTNERTVTRKVKEAILAYRITQMFSKEKVLELYLNKIFLGNHSYGIVAAARNYFNKRIDQLNISEAAMLAALPKAPSYLNPVKHYDIAKNRRDWVISRMAFHGIISPLEARKYTKLPIDLQRGKLLEDLQESFYTEKVRQDTIELLGEDVFYKRGLLIFINQDLKLQKIAEEILNRKLERYDKLRGWRGPIGFIPNLKDDNWTKYLGDYARKAYSGKFRLAVVLNSDDKGILVGESSGHVGLIYKESLTWICGKDKKSGCIERKLKQLRKGDLLLIDPNKGRYQLAQVPRVEGAIVALEPQSGKVMAMVGGYNFDRSKFNRALQAKRQPGSVFKPFIYLTALEQGYPPNSIILDEPIELEQGNGLPIWIPRNYNNDFLGPITLRHSLEKSRNVATVRLLTKLGLKPVGVMARKLGIYQDPPLTYSMALGSYETTLMNVTNAYNIIASGGKRTIPQYIDSIYNRQGKLLYVNKSVKRLPQLESLGIISTFTPPDIKYKYKRIIDKLNNYQLLNMLEGTVQRGTARRAKIKGVTLAGKTGTTNNSMDVWFVGFSHDLVVGVYIGFDSPRSLGKGATGATIALPVFKELMQKVSGHTQDKAFDVPEDIIMLPINSKTGDVLSPEEPVMEVSTIMEAFKKSNIYASQDRLQKKDKENLDEVIKGMY